MGAGILKTVTESIVRIGPFVAVGDGFTPQTGVTLGAADDAVLMAPGGGAAVDISGATWAAVSGAAGWYDLTLTTILANSIGEYVVYVRDDSLSLPVFARFYLVPANTFEALYSDTAQAFDANRQVGCSILSTSAKSNVLSQVTAGLATYDGPTNAEMVARTILAADYFDPAADAVANVTLVATTTTNTDTAATLVATDVQIAAVKAKTDLIVAATAVAVVSPIAADGDIELVRGDDYDHADSRAIDWTSSGWPDLTGGTVEFTARHRTTGANDIEDEALTIVAATAPATVRMELTAAQTAALELGQVYQFDVQATLASGNIVTLARGDLNVLRDFQG